MPTLVTSDHIHLCRHNRFRDAVLVQGKQEKNYVLILSLNSRQSTLVSLLSSPTEHILIKCTQFVLQNLLISLTTLIGQ